MLCVYIQVSWAQFALSMFLCFSHSCNYGRWYQMKPHTEPISGCALCISNTLLLDWWRTGGEFTQMEENYSVELPPSSFSVSLSYFCYLVSVSPFPSFFPLFINFPSLISLQWPTHFAFLYNLTPPNICFTASKRSFCALNVRQIRAADHQDSTVADKQWQDTIYLSDVWEWLSAE